MTKKKLKEQIKLFQIENEHLSLRNKELSEELHKKERDTASALSFLRLEKKHLEQELDSRWDKVVELYEDIGNKEIVTEEQEEKIEDLEEEKANIKFEIKVFKKSIRSLIELTAENNGLNFEEEYFEDMLNGNMTVIFEKIKEFIDFFAG